MIRKFIALLSATAIFFGAAAEETLIIKANKPGAKIQPTMYGHFFEDINFAADGGLYAELVKNRSFEFPDPLMGWQSFGSVEVKNDGPFERNSHYVSLLTPVHPTMRSGLENEGFFGVAFREGEEYRFSVWARAKGENSKIRVELIDPSTAGKKQSMASAELPIEGKEWKKYQVVLTPTQTVADGRLRVTLSSSHPCDLEHISLFPVNTFNGHENGLRADLAQKLKETNPGVFRFPGGCIIEGTTLEDRYQWKNTVGPVENRPTILNRWSFCMPDRAFPDYYQSGGLGFYEYFLLSEEIGAEPLPVLNCGMLCQFMNRDPSAHVPVDSLQPFLRDALDLIEFANGATDTQWGALRAEMGHPEPFNLKYIAIGNEQWGREYTDRSKHFVKAIRKAHPEIMIVGSAGPKPNGDGFLFLWDEMKHQKVDLVDEHYYANEEFFAKNASRYDSYDRKGPKVFAGEYACHAKDKKFNHFNAALMEAALMTGLERNADIVHMATYAPLFAHVKGWQWRPDLIWFDGLNSVGSASYYVQQMFGQNKGTRVLPLTLNKKPVAGLEGQDGLFATAALDEQADTYIVKVVNTSDTPRDLNLLFTGKKNLDFKTLTIITLHSDDPDADNIDSLPASHGTTLSGALTPRIVPVTKEYSVEGVDIPLTVPARTFAVYLLK